MSPPTSLAVSLSAVVPALPESGREVSTPSRAVRAISVVLTMRNPLKKNCGGRPRPGGPVYLRETVQVGVRSQVLLADGPPAGGGNCLTYLPHFTGEGGKNTTQ